MRDLGIHQMTALDTDPVALVGLVARAGCQAVSLFTRQPGERSRFPLVERAHLTAIRDAMRAASVAVYNVESFMLTPATRPAEFAAALSLGAELGARNAGVQIFDTDPSRVGANLALLAEMTGPLGLQLAVEFMPLSPAWKTLEDITRLVRQLALPNLVIGIDVLHLVRSGGSIEGLAALPPGLAGYAQLCDGASLEQSSDYAAEAGGNRLVPGEGVFPLLAFLRALPQDTPLELEVPQAGAQPAADRLPRLVTATRALLEAADARDA